MNMLRVWAADCARSALSMSCATGWASWCGRSSGGVCLCDALPALAGVPAAGRGRSEGDSPRRAEPSQRGAVCGGNEFSPKRNAPVVEALQRAAAGDATRLFLPASPMCGDSHNWQVWHGYAAPAAYCRDRARFASEFGLQAPPSVAALRRFVPEGEVWPPGPSWSYHKAGLKKLERYALPFLGGRQMRDVGLERLSSQPARPGTRAADRHRALIAGARPKGAAGAGVATE